MNIFNDDILKDLDEVYGESDTKKDETPEKDPLLSPNQLKFMEKMQDLKKKQQDAEMEFAVKCLDFIKKAKADAREEQKLLINDMKSFMDSSDLAEFLKNPIQQ